MNRTPPAAVRKQLREEVGFGCPVKDCGNPYLTWHHFAPPFAIREHHDPDGMIALCLDHHAQANRGAFTDDQLRALKRNGRDRTSTLGARFNWMRHHLLAVIGGCFYYEVPIAVRIGDTPIVWFNRDENGLLLLSLRVPTTSGMPRLSMAENFWSTPGSDESDIVCPPMGRLVDVKYPNGDRLKVEFREVSSVDEFNKCHPPPALPDHLSRDLEQAGIAVPDPSSAQADSIERFGIEFPLATVEVTLVIADTDIALGPTATSIGNKWLVGNWTVRAAVGIQIGDPA